MLFAAFLTGVSEKQRIQQGTVTERVFLVQTLVRDLMREMDIAGGRVSEEQANKGVGKRMIIKFSF